MSSSLVPETGFAQGASGGGNVYDTSPAGLGLSPAYLASTSASASSSTTTAGTIFPTSPADGNVFIYLADATNGVNWAFKYNAGSASTYKWEFIGGPPLVSEVATSEATASTTYAALSTAGPSVVLARAGDYLVTVAGHGIPPAVSGASAFMSYDIGGTGAVDADSVRISIQDSASRVDAHMVHARVKTGLSAVTLTAKYRMSTGTSGSFFDRVLTVFPVRVI